MIGKSLQTLRAEGRKPQDVRRKIAKIKITVQRAGIADGGEFYIRPPGTAAWLFDKVKY